MSSTDPNATPDVADILAMLREGKSIAPELQEIFSEEAEDHLRAIYDGLDRVQVNHEDRVALADIRRASHTLKGAAGAVGVPSVTRLSHRMEDLLDDLAENGRPMTSEIVMLLLSTADRLQELTGESFDVEQMAKSIVEIYGQYHVLLPTAGQDPAINQTVNVDADFEADFDADDEELGAALAAFGFDADEEADETDIEAAEEFNALQKAESIEQPAVEPTATENSSNQNVPAPQVESHIRVPLSRLDDMVRLVGEMIINRSSFAQRLSDFTGQIDDLQVALNRLQGVSEDVETRYSVDALNRRDRGLNLPAGDRFRTANRWKPFTADGTNESEFDELEFDQYSEFHLLARTLSEATGDVASVARECGVLSGDFDALLGRWQRLTRDAQDRLMQIRMVPLRTIIPRLGRAVRSTASQCGKSVNFVVRGDHTELDKTVLEEIADPLLHLVRNAVDHGLETPEDRVRAGKPKESMLTIEAINQGTQLTLRIEDDGRGLDAERIRQRAIEKGLISSEQSLSTEELQRLIFAPGFSTAAAITDVSGRGVGMDVVRETIHRLKGTIRLDSTPGEGLKFTIILPTTLAVTRALVVEGAGDSFAIPMQAISQISRLDPQSVRHIGEDAMVELGERTVRLCRLTDKLGLSKPESFDKAMPMLVIESGDRSTAVLVDDIQGGQDIVVKTLGDHLRKVPGIIGASIRGDGSVIPILDPADLVGLARNTMAANTDSTDTDAFSGPQRRRNVLIVDDSVSVRRITASVMRGGGWSVHSAKDGVDALEQLTNMDRYPDVILLDMEMPRMDGLELLAHLRADIAFAETPVVMVTSRAGDKHRKRAMDAGATEYVIKPFRDDQLLAIAARLADKTSATVEAS